MNVLMLGWEYPPHISGGLGTACQGLVQGMKKAGGIDLTFVLPELHGEEDLAGARFICAKSLSTGQADGGECGGTDGERLRVYLAGFLSAESLAQFFDDRDDDFLALEDSTQARRTGAYQGVSISGALMYASLANRIIAAAGQFDIIHAHDWLTFLAAAHIKKTCKTPLVVHVHSLELDRAGTSINRDILAIERFGMHMADKIIVVSNYTRQILVREYGVAEDKIDVVHNGVEPLAHPMVPAERSSFVVSFVGRITQQKGPIHFLQAAKKVLEQRRDIRFVMAGTGDMLPLAKATASRLGIADAVDFPGFLDRAGVTALLASSSVYVMPSASEPFGIGALEAAQAGVPVVLSKNSGALEVVDHFIAVDHWDTAAIAESILWIRDHPELAKKNAAVAKARVTSLTWASAAKKIGDLYANLLAKTVRKETRRELMAIAPACPCP